MLKKLDQQQLAALSPSKLKAYRLSVEARKVELMALKEKGGDAWTPELQDELDDFALALVDIDEIAAGKAVSAEEKPVAEEHVPVEEEKGYEVPEGTEKMVHLRLVKGRRFNSNTGEEISEPFVQMFTYGEYQLFKKNGASLGYIVVETLHNPYEK